MIIESLKIFNRVAKVLGKVDATKQIKIATNPEYLIDDEELGGCFIWMDSPQGHDYWADIESKME